MQDRLPESNLPLLDQVLVFYAPNLLLVDDIVDQSCMFLQERLQTDRAARLGASKTTHSWGVANGYNTHGDISFQGSEFGIPIFLREGVAVLSLNKG
jgi:hypothetical protein